MATPYRYTRAVSRRQATGLVARVYTQVNDDFILADGPLMSLSPAPELLAATWALLREAQVVGTAPRAEKELVAAAVSGVNRCPFCVGAHTALLHATGEHELAEVVWSGGTPGDPRHAGIVAWARATAVPGSPDLSSPPFSPELAPEYIGTALVTHFINRMTSALIDEQALAARLQSSALVRRLAGKAFARVVRQHPPAGESLPLLANGLAGAPPSWASGTAIGSAYRALMAAGAAGGNLLSREARTVVLGTVGGWDGNLALQTFDWIEDALVRVPDGDRPGARLALLAALAPHRISAGDIADWRTTHPNDDHLVRVLAYGAVTAMERIESWTITVGTAAALNAEPATWGAQ